MSGAQGAEPKGSRTATTYESVKGEEKKPVMDPVSTEDERGIRVDKGEDKVPVATGKGGLIFGAGDVDNKQHLGVTGTG